MLVFVLSFSSFAAETKDVVNGNSSFAFDLYGKLKETDGNLFFSPYSISTALAMTYAGARNETEKEMAEVLRFPSDQDVLHSSFSELQTHLNAVQEKGHVLLSVANSLWAQEGYPFLDSFIDLNKKYYGAGLNLVDFATKTEEVRQTINIWVEDKTRQKIKDLIKPGMLDPSTTLVLCNAIYFKGDWLKQFDEKKTIEASFRVSPEENIKVPMMNLKSEFKLAKSDGVSALELPYSGDELSMIVFLPNDVGGMKELEEKLTDGNVEKWIKTLSASREKEIMVSLPKFKVTCEFELADIFSKMGMPHAFRGADFSGMTGSRDLFIGRVIHKAFVDVNEEGTEAAAATAVMMERALHMPLVFRADHPFVFLIRENKTGSVLFIGRITNPEP